VRGVAKYFSLDFDLKVKKGVWKNSEKVIIIDLKMDVEINVGIVIVIMIRQCRYQAMNYYQLEGS